MQAIEEKRDLDDILGISASDPASLDFATLQEKEDAEAKRQIELLGEAAEMAGVLLPVAAADASKAGGAGATTEQLKIESTRLAQETAQNVGANVG